MERRKRVYPGDNSRLVSAILLVLTAVIIISGLISKNGTNGFVLENLPKETAVPLDEAFDETATEAMVELPVIQWYALQVGVFENEESARQSAIAFQKRGAAGYLWQDGRYRVLAAAYPTQEDAQQVRSQLRDQHDIDSYLYAIEFPALSMKMSGMKGQIEILQAAFGHAQDLAEYVHSLSIQTDRQEISVQDAVAQIEAMNTQMKLVSLRLCQRFESPVHAVVQAVISCFDDYDRFAAAVSSAESAAAFGMKLKYQLFETLQQLQNIYQTLNHT